MYVVSKFSVNYFLIIAKPLQPKFNSIYVIDKSFIMN